MDVGKDREKNEDLEDDGISQEPAFVPARRGHQDDSRAKIAATQQHDEIGAGSSTGGPGGRPPQADEDDEEEEEEEGNAWEAMDRETEALIWAELRKAEESLYDAAATSAPLPLPAPPSEAETSSPTQNNNDDNDDDLEAQFWAAHRAQQAEAERKALEKEANFIQEWSSAFVHLRVVGRAVPPPSFPPPPLSNLENEEEILASHGNGGNVNILAVGRGPSPLACKEPASCSNNKNNKPTEDLLLEEAPKKAADPTKVQNEELMARLLEGVWQDCLTLLERPLAQLLIQKEDGAQQEYGQEGPVNKGDVEAICGEGSCNSVAATTAHKRKLSS